MEALRFFDDKLADHFQPLTLTRPVADLRIGIFTIAEKWCRSLNIQRYAYHTQPHIQRLFMDSYPTTENVDTEIWINSRYLPNRKLINTIKQLNLNEGIAQNGTLIAGKIDAAGSDIEADLADIKQKLHIVSTENEYYSCLNRLWDMLAVNGSEIKRDLDLEKQDSNYTDLLPKHVIATEPSQLFLHSSAKVEPGVIFITDEGPIYIGENVHIMAGSMLRGPLSIGKGARIKMGAKIYKNTTIGPHCKIGGEVKHAIFHSYSNKGHEGFTGNSIIGQWCNMGADTNTSNLKNNYSLLRMTDYRTGNQIQTDQQFIGTIMGDHCKTSINTMLNTGTIIGVSSNIFCSRFPPKHVRSFRWLGDENQQYIFDKALETMHKVMERREFTLTSDYEKMMESIFKNDSKLLAGE